MDIKGSPPLSSLSQLSAVLSKAGESSGCRFALIQDNERSFSGKNVSGQAEKEDELASMTEKL